MSSDERSKAFLTGAIFSRVQPEQKFELIKTLQNARKTVAMVGDGVNDAPALKAADIGVSMGHNASDVARSSAQIVLLNSNFSGIVAAIYEGRRILKNLQRSFSYLVSFHMPVVLYAFVPSLMGWPVLLMPIHIIMLELIVHPISAFSFENLAMDSNQSKKVELLDRGRIFEAFLGGLAVSIFGLIYFHYLTFSQSPEVARTSAVLVALFANIAFVIRDTFGSFNRRFYITVFLLLAITIGLWIFSPVTLHFGSIGIAGLIISFLGGILGFVPSIRLLLPKREQN